MFDLPDATFQGPLSADQETLAADMRAAWANFAETGDPSTDALTWPTAGNGLQSISFDTPGPQLSYDYAAQHHVAFWLQG